MFKIRTSLRLVQSGTLLLPERRQSLRSTGILRELGGHGLQITSVRKKNQDAKNAVLLFHVLLDKRLEVCFITLERYPGLFPHKDER